MYCLLLKNVVTFQLQYSSPAQQLQKQARMMQGNLLKPFSGWERASCLFSPHTFIQEVLSPHCSVFFFCSPNVMLLFIPDLPLFWTTNHRLALFVFRTTNCLFLIQALLASLPHCPRSLIVFASVCPLLFMECKTAGVQRGSLELYYSPQPNRPITAKRPWKGLVRDRKPSVTSATPPPLQSTTPRLPALLSLQWEDEEMTLWTGSNTDMCSSSFMKLSAYSSSFFQSQPAWCKFLWWYIFIPVCRLPK